MPGTDGHELTYSSWAGILAVAVPAVVQSGTRAFRCFQYDACPVDESLSRAVVPAICLGRCPPEYAFKLPTPVSLPIIVAIVAAPLTTTLQTAWLGLNGSVALAAFSAVNTSAVFAVKIFIFFTDGVAAKVGSWWPGAGMSW